MIKFKHTLLCLFLSLIALSSFARSAEAQLSFEGSVSYRVVPANGFTEIHIDRVSNFNYEDKKAFIGLAFSKTPYSGGSYTPNFVKALGTLQARTYYDNVNINGYGGYPTSGTWYVTLALGEEVNGKVTTAQYFNFPKTVTIGAPDNNKNVDKPKKKKGKKNKKKNKKNKKKNKKNKKVRQNLLQKVEFGISEVK